MKRLIPFVLVFGLGLTVAAMVVSRQQAARHAREIEAQRAAWEIERADLEAELANARLDRPITSALPRAERVIVKTPAPDARELLKRLAELKVTPGAA